MKQLGKPCSGGAFPLNEQGHKEGEVPFIKVSDMNLPGNERFIRSANHYVSRATLAELGVRPAPAGTTVFPKIGAAIASNKKRLLTRDTAFDNNVQGVNPLKPESTFYLYAFSERFDLMRLARATTLPSIRPTELAELPVQAPPLKLQAEFGRIYEQTCSSLDEQAQSRAALELLFQTMLHRAFTGELTARWREAHEGTAGRDGAASAAPFRHYQRHRMISSFTIGNFKAFGPAQNIPLKPIGACSNRSCRRPPRPR